MPISNQSSQNRMTTTTLRVDPRQTRTTKRRAVVLNDNHQYQNAFPTAESPPIHADLPSQTISRGSPRMFRVKRVSRDLPTPTPPEPELSTKKSVVKDMTSRGTTPPPTSFFDTFPTNNSVHYPSSYQTRGQQVVSTVRYRTPSPLYRPRTTTSDVFVQQKSQGNALTTTKTSTRYLDATTLETRDDGSFIEETKTTTTIIKPLEIPTAPAVIASSVTTVPAVAATTTTIVPPAIETTTIRDRPVYRPRRRTRVRSISTLSDYTTSSTGSYYTESTITPRPVVKQHVMLPPRPPILTTVINDPPATIVPERRFIHHVRRTRTYSGYYSSDLDHGKRKIYKSDYKYRHFYYCNWCKGRYDLPNSSCSCCEWFYGCPLWALIFLGLLFLALLVTFFTLLGLQPSINSARFRDTAKTQVINNTRIVYGFLQNCGVQAGSPTTLAQCANTAATKTSITQISGVSRSKSIQSSIAEKLFLVSCCTCIYSYFSVNIHN